MAFKETCTSEWNEYRQMKKGIKKYLTSFDTMKMWVDSTISELNKLSESLEQTSGVWRKKSVQDEDHAAVGEIENMVREIPIEDRIIAIREKVDSFREKLNGYDDDPNDVDFDRLMRE